MNIDIEFKKKKIMLLFQKYNQQCSLNLEWNESLILRVFQRLWFDI